jgi:protein TonB
MAQSGLTHSLYRGRDLIALLPSLLIFVALIGVGFKNARAIRYHDDKPVEVSLVEPPVEQPPPPQPEPPKPAEAPKPTPQPTPTQPVVPVPTPIATTAPQPAPTQPVVEVPKPVPVPPPPPAPVAQPRPVVVDLQGEYVAKLRAQLNAIKRYPTGREASQLRPQGKVKLWFSLKRDGSLADAGVEESSNSMLLDDAARKTLNRASFPAFPDQAWNGEATHRFTAELDFVPPG